MLLLIVTTACAPATDDRAVERPPLSPQVERTLAAPGYDWRKVELGDFDLYAPSTAVSADSLERLAAQFRNAVRDVAARLGEDSLPAAHIFFVGSPAELAELAGGPGGGRTDVRAGAIYYVAADGGRPPLRHEFAHLVTWRNWGDPPAYWISEGAALFGAGTCEGHDLHAWAAALRDEDRLTPFEALESDFDFSSAAAHLQAGSFVQHVHETYGIDGVHALWRGGRSALARHAGVAEASLEERWRAAIRRMAIPDAVRGRTGRIRCE